MCLKLFFQTLATLMLLGIPVVAAVKHENPISIHGNINAIGTETEYLLDRSTSLTLEQILQHQREFTKSSEETLNFGVTPSACWIHFSYLLSDSTARFLEIGNPNLNLIDYYVLREGKVIFYQQAGLAGKHASETFKQNAWLLGLPRSNGQQLDIYLRVTDLRRVIVPLRITDLDGAIRTYHRTDFLFGLYFGCITILGVMYVLFFFYFKERMYLYYSFHILIQIIINGILKGYLLSLFGRVLYFLSPYVATLAGLSHISTILFSLAFLNVKKHSPTWHKVGVWLILLPAINSVLSLTGLVMFSSQVGVFIGFAVITFLFALGIVAYRCEIKQSRFYLVGWSFFLVGLAILNASLVGWLPINDFTYNAAIYGTLFEVLLISAALADRVNLMRLEGIREREQKDELVKQQHAWLEQNVKLRTVELTEKTLEVEAQNEELKQQHEEIVVTNELLEKQRQLVVDANQGLEQKVQERTVELEETVKRLIKQNFDLQQFSYIVSHNMRAPVARILGLLALIELNKSSEDEKAALYRYLQESALGLDQIIQDLTNIITIRKELATTVEPIDVARILKHNQVDLTDEIQRADGVITCSVKVDRFVSVKSYVQSILYNLLSNAIKYRSPKRKLEVLISVFKENDNVVLVVKDNGLGIDLPVDRLHEIFNLYKRFHTHTSGKGLGLYLVRTQVEALNGTIDVDTVLDGGTTFTVTIPSS